MGRFWRGPRPKSAKEVQNVLKLYGYNDTKFGNEPTDGYASKKEARRAGELKMLQRAGKIYDLREQVRYELVPAQDGERAVHYVADFVYKYVGTDGTEEVEDVKGVRTPEYVIKRKLMLKVHGIRIKEV